MPEENKDNAGFLIHIAGLASGKPIPYLGWLFIQDYDPSIHEPDGTYKGGRLVLTSDPFHAKIYRSKQEAVKERERGPGCKCHGTRPDGKPNCPLMAYNLLVIPLADALCNTLHDGPGPEGTVRMEGGLEGMDWLDAKGLSQEAIERGIGMSINMLMQSPTFATNWDLVLSAGFLGISNLTTVESKLSGDPHHNSVFDRLAPFMLESAVKEPSMFSERLLGCLVQYFTMGMLIGCITAVDISQTQQTRQLAHMFDIQGMKN